MQNTDNLQENVTSVVPSTSSSASVYAPSQSLSQQPVEDPGKKLALVGILVSVFGFAVVGTILSIVAYVKSKKAGFKNKLAIAGIVAGSILFVIGTIVLVFVSFAFADFFSGLIQKCNELGPGLHKVGNTTYECGTTRTEFKVGI